MKAVTIKPTAHTAAVDVLFQALTEYAQEAMVALSREGLVIYLSPSLEEIVGHSTRTALGKAFFELIHPPDREQLERAMNAALGHAERPVRLSFRIAAEEGSLRSFDGVITFVDTRLKQPLLVINASDVTSHKKTLAALAESEANLADIQRMAKIGSWYWDADTDEFAGSEEAYRIYGIDAVGRPATLNGYLTRVHQDDQINFHRAVLQTLANREPFCLSHRFVRKGGEVIIVRHTGEAVSDARGKAKGIKGTTQDITAERCAEETLLRKEELLNEAQAVSNVGSWETDLTTGEVFWSAEMCRLLGYEPGVRDTSGEAYMRRVHPDDRPRLEESIRRLKAGEPVKIDYRLSIDGKIRHVHARGQANSDDSGKTVRTYGSVQDITERVAYEAALRRSEERLEEAQRIARIGSWEVDFVNRKSYGSREFFRLYANSPILGADDLEFLKTGVHPQDVPLVADFIDQITGQKQTATAEFRILAGDQTRWVSARGECETDEDGALLRASGTLQDITDRKQAETQLLRVQKMESVGQLTSGIAHDFNNLLMIIIGNLELINSRIDDEKGLKDQISAAIRAANRGADLTQNLLSFSRRQSLAAAPTDVSALIEGMSRIICPTLGQSIKIETAIRSELWPILVDPAQLESALLNLAVNARDAMPGGGQLRIGAENLRIGEAGGSRYGEIPPGDYVVISVADTGCGMTDEVKERVFEPFFTTKEFGRGSGLGLSMVYGFVKQSGGRIHIQSEEGKGTTVRLFLPRLLHAKNDEETCDAPDGERKQRETILVVEDDPDVRSFVVGTLARLGYATLEASDGPAALKYVEEGAAFDLLFTDLILPGGLNGTEVADAVTTCRPDVAVVYTSGYSANLLEEQKSNGTSTEILPKPYPGTVLAESVRRALKDRQAQASPESD